MSNSSQFVVDASSTIEVGQEAPPAIRTKTLLAAASAPSWVPVSGYTRAFERTTDNTARIFSVITFPQYPYRADAAYEHDIKTTMNDAGTGIRPFCFSTDDHSGWAIRAGTSFVTDLPLPYFDTNASDGCDTIDLTVGSYSIAGAAGKTFTINTISQRGTAISSHYSLNAQMLQNNCDVKNTPLCVGIRIPSWAASYLLVGSTYGIMPGCRSWSAGNSSAPC
jgi:hypothetical protein